MSPAPVPGAAAAVLAAALQAEPLPPATRPVVVGVALAYFAAVAVIGAWATRRTRTAGDFFVAGKGIGLVALSLAAMSATLSGFTFIGGPGLVYATGLGGVHIVLPAALTGALVAWALAKRLRLLAEVRDVLTIPDAIGIRYASPAAQGLSAVAILVAVVGYMATNVLALGIVVDAIFGVGVGWGIWIGTGVVLAYTVTGGILAGVYADVLQGTMMAGASVLVFAYVLEVGGGLGGISRTILAADPEFLGPWGSLSPMAAVSLFFVFGLGALGQPHVLHKFYMIRDPRRLKWYPVVVTGAIVLTILLYVGVGLAVKALVADGRMPPLPNPDLATPLFLLRHTPLALAALAFSGMAAAIMSTVNSFLSVGAAALTHDLPVALGRTVDDELLGGRIATVALSLGAALTAQLSGTLVAFLGIFGWGLFASTLVPALAVGLNWPGATRAGAVASIATGLGFTLLFETLGYLGLYTLPEGVAVSGAALVLSLLVFCAVSRWTEGGEAAELPADVRAVLEA